MGGGLPRTLLAQACSLCLVFTELEAHPSKKIACTGGESVRTAQVIILITLLKKKIVRGDSPPVRLRTSPLKRKKCILIISSTTTSPRASRTTKVAGTPLLPHCAYTLAVGNRSMPKDNRLSSLALLSDAYKPPIAPSIASPLSFSFPEAPRHCP